MNKLIRGENILDFMFIFYLGYFERCKIFFLIGNSDYDIVLLDLVVKVIRFKFISRIINFWKKVNMEGINKSFIDNFMEF